MLDEDFINRKIRLIAEDMGRLEELKDYTLDELAKDFYKLNTAERLLEKIVIRATDINNHLIAELGKGIEKVRGYRDSFLRLADFGIYSEEFAEKIGESARFRNILVHDYNNTDKNLIHKKIGEVSADFNEYSNCILKFIEKNKEAAPGGKPGFTLLELLVVIAVVGILSTMIYASLSQSRTKARDSKRIATINQLRKALDMYLSDRGYYPTSLDDLFNSGYISAIPEDRIGNQGDKSICSAEVRRYPPYNEKGYCYGYAPSSNPTYYHLGVDLELDNPVLDADANKEDLRDVENGFDAKYPGREMIYDVVP